MYKKVLNYIKKSHQKRIIKLFKYFGDSNDINVNTKFIFPQNIEIKSFVYIGPGGYLNGQGGLIIKSGTIIGPNITIYTSNHRFRDADFLPYDSVNELKPVTINENVWIGGNVIITPGSNIGEGCVIGAGCVVSGNIPPCSIVVGNPCQIIKSRDINHYNKLKAENKIYLKDKLST
ncbi:acyltransferase [Empedobacter tilapiae]